MVRVAGLMGQEEAGCSCARRTADRARDARRNPREDIELSAAQAKLWKRDLRPALADAGVIVGASRTATRRSSRARPALRRDIFPILTPLAVGPGQPFPYISPLSLSLGILVRDPETGDERFARVKVPELLPRFFSVGERGLFLPLERVIRHFLPRLFPEMEIVECCTFRVTRDADLEVSDEADDLLEAVQDELRRRRFGDVVRVEVSGSVSTRMLERLERGLSADEQIYLTRACSISPICRSSCDRPAGPEGGAVVSRSCIRVSRRQPMPTSSSPRSGAATSSSTIPSTRSPRASKRSCKAAARDPAVVALKTALYRTSEDSPGRAGARSTRRERGKQSMSLIELKARFDESRNIEWSRSLEQAGVHVVYGFPNLKIHAKTTLIVRREGDELRRYVAPRNRQLQHPRRAQAYEDYGLFTADADITADVADLFNYLTGFSRPQPFRKLLVAPFGLRDGMVEQIREVRRAAANGKEARIRIKVNSLNDEELIEELYRASQEGRRSTSSRAASARSDRACPGLSETIRVRSIAGPLPRAQPHLHLRSGRQRIDPHRQRRPHAAQPRSPDRARRPGRGLGAHSRSSSVRSTSSWRTTRPRGSSAPKGRWMKLRPKKGDRGRQAQQVFMRSARARARRRAASLRTR